MPSDDPSSKAKAKHDRESFIAYDQRGPHRECDLVGFTVSQEQTLDVFQQPLWVAKDATFLPVQTVHATRWLWIMMGARVLECGAEEITRVNRLQYSVESLAELNLLGFGDLPC